MRDEPAYTFGSADDPRSHLREYIFGDRQHLTSKHGLTCLAADKLAGSAVLLARRLRKRLWPVEPPRRG